MFHETEGLFYKLFSPFYDNGETKEDGKGSRLVYDIASKAIQKRLRQTGGSIEKGHIVRTLGKRYGKNHRDNLGIGDKIVREDRTFEDAVQDVVALTWRRIHLYITGSRKPRIKKAPPVLSVELAKEKILHEICQATRQVLRGRSATEHERKLSTEALAQAILMQSETDGTEQDLSEHMDTMAECLDREEVKNRQARFCAENGLTEAETAVALLKCEGSKNATISRIRKVNESTVHRQVKSSERKLAKVLADKVFYRDLCTVLTGVYVDLPDMFQRHSV